MIFRYPVRNGDYTQLAWAKSEELGCGMVYFKEGWSYKTLLICNYATAGNWIGKTMYEIGEACSRCPSGYLCLDGLCSAH